MKRGYSHRLYKVAGVLSIFMGVLCCLVILTIPFGIFFIKLGRQYLFYAKQHKTLKKQLRNLKIPVLPREEPIVTRPPYKRYRLKSGQ